MDKSKIFITNYPRMQQCVTFTQVEDASQTLNLICGYDVRINRYEITLQIARDLITALLTFDKIYIEGDHIHDIIQVFGSDYLKELLRLHLLCVIPDQNLNPAMIQKGKGEWMHGFFPYPQGNLAVANNRVHKWSHVENWFNKKNFKGLNVNTLLYLIDENAVDIGNVDDVIKKINEETDRDIKSNEFLSDPNFYRVRPDGKLEYNQVSRIRLQELNKSAVLSAILNIDNIKMDAAFNELIFRKTSSAFSKDIHCGTDALISIEQQKGFPDLGELFVKKVIGLDDILKLRDNFHGKIFRYWVKKADYEEELMRREVMNSVHNVLGSKCMNPLRMVASNLIGIMGFLPGLAASAFDSYILDSISKGWHPNFFLDDKLKKMIDDCVAKEQEGAKIQKLKETFKGVRRNDLCPCGSGIKFKKCHGKDL